jgi:hypothetical protein
MADETNTFPTDGAWSDDKQETDTNTDVFGSAAEAVHDFGAAYRRLQKREERREKYWAKALPFIWESERLKQATIRRETDAKRARIADVHAEARAKR